MINDLNTNSDTKSPNIEVEKGSILKATGIKITPNGIEYFINPPLKRCIVHTMDSIKEKDLILSCWIIKPNQNSLFFRTNIISPMVYKSNSCQFIFKEEEMVFSIYKIGDEIAEVIEILD